MPHPVVFEDLGTIGYRAAWDYQEQLLRGNLAIKSQPADPVTGKHPTTSYLLFCEHPPVYTLGKSGKAEHILISETEMQARGIEFYHTNRGGDITFHGPGQLVGYPILDLEYFGTDIGRYLRNLEEVIIRSLADAGISAGRSAGETGVWLDPDMPGRERKICAMGVRCSRWITMHGFAVNVNTDLTYFDHIVPCGIRNKQVASINAELDSAVTMAAVKAAVQRHFCAVFNAVLTAAVQQPL
jgi:lipoyl(octanoyl) transferase